MVLQIVVNADASELINKYLLAMTVRSAMVIFLLWDSSCLYNASNILVFITSDKVQNDFLCYFIGFDASKLLYFRKETPKKNRKTR